MPAAATLPVPTVDWLENYARLTRQAVLDAGYQRASCVASTRVGLDVLRYFGVPAKPQSVRALCGPADKVHQLINEEPVEHPFVLAGIGQRGLTERDDGRKFWDGHLVVLVANPVTLIDLSADQMSRPERDMVVPGPVVVSGFDPNAWNRPTNMVLATPHEGTAVLYLKTDNHLYRQSSGWRSNQVSDVTAAAIRLLKAA